MAVRVTAEEVQAIMEGTFADSDIIDETYIVAASALVDQVFSGDANIGDTLLKEIERWLTAHMIAISLQRTAASEEIEGAKVKWTGSWGKGLESTSYGQMVLLLDTSGKMAKAGKAAIKIRAITSFEV